MNTTSHATATATKPTFCWQQARGRAWDRLAATSKRNMTKQTNARAFGWAQAPLTAPDLTFWKMDDKDCTPLSARSLSRRFSIVEAAVPLTIFAPKPLRPQGYRELAGPSLQGRSCLTNTETVWCAQKWVCPSDTRGSVVLSPSYGLIHLVVLSRLPFSPFWRGLLPSVPGKPFLVLDSEIEIGSEIAS